MSNIFDKRSEENEYRQSNQDESENKYWIRDEDDGR